MHARLQSLEAWVSRFVDSHDLAVDDKSFKREHPERARDFRVGCGDLLSVPAIQLCLFPRASGQNSDAVVLDLEEPLLSGKRAASYGSQHESLALGRDVGYRDL